MIKILCKISVYHLPDQYLPWLLPTLVYDNYYEFFLWFWLVLISFFIDIQIPDSCLYQFVNIKITVWFPLLRHQPCVLMCCQLVTVQYNYLSHLHTTRHSHILTCTSYFYLTIYYLNIFNDLEKYIEIWKLDLIYF